MSRYQLKTTETYPYLDNDGNIELGTAIIFTENMDELEAFNSNITELILIIDKNGKTLENTLDLKRENLSNKYKNMSEEILDNLINVRQNITLSKAYKNLQNGILKYEKLDFDIDEANILNKAISNNRELEKKLLAQINDGESNNLETMLETYKFKKHLLCTGEAGQY